jgi:hypothetical protein
MNWLSVIMLFLQYALLNIVLAFCDVIYEPPSFRLAHIAVAGALEDIP